MGTQVSVSLNVRVVEQDPESDRELVLLANDLEAHRSDPNPSNVRSVVLCVIQAMLEIGWREVDLLAADLRTHLYDSPSNLHRVMEYVRGEMLVLARAGAQAA